MHLTGLEPIGKNGRSIKPTKFLHDFANGGELAYDDILIDKFLLCLHNLFYTTTKYKDIYVFY